MPLCFATCDPHMYGAPTSHLYGHRFARASPCASGLDIFFGVLLALTFLPLVLPILMFLVSLAFFVMRTLLVAFVIGKIASCLCGADVDCASRSCATKPACASGCPCPMAACFAKMKAACCAKERSAAAATSTVRDELSAARACNDAQTFTITVAAPGVRPSDISVDVIDRTLRIKGSTRRGDEVWRVNREFTPPRLVDVATAQCTHQDGVLTIKMSRVPTTRVPVVPVVVADAVAASPAPAEEKKASAAAPPAEPTAEGASSENEWDAVADEDTEQ